ncbi:hypothetical protein WN943_015543 [Citrus x changshan-huyou]
MSNQKIEKCYNLSYTQSELESSLETEWTAECESHKSIFTASPHSKLGRIAWPDALVQQICKCTKVQIVKLFHRLQRKSKISQDEDKFPQCITAVEVHIVLVKVVCGAANATPSPEDILRSRERCGSYGYVT